MIDPQSLSDVLASLGQPSYRARQVYEAVTRRFVTGYDEITVLPRELRARLAETLPVVSLEVREERVTPQGDARKVLFAARDGVAIEAVLMAGRDRATVCVSTQAGCAVRCAFCASGAGGLRRDLTAEEMVDQVLYFARILRDESARRVTNVVFMGMGEPFHNYDQTLRACRLLNDPGGFGLKARGISVSTVGVIPGIRRFAQEPLQLNLAVSLHAATDACATGSCR